MFLGDNVSLPKWRETNPSANLHGISHICTYEHHILAGTKHEQMSLNSVQLNTPIEYGK